MGETVYLEDPESELAEAMFDAGYVVMSAEAAQGWSEVSR